MTESKSIPHQHSKLQVNLAKKNRQTTTTLHKSLQRKTTLTCTRLYSRHVYHGQLVSAWESRIWHLECLVSLPFHDCRVGNGSRVFQCLAPASIHKYSRSMVFDRYASHAENVSHVTAEVWSSLGEKLQRYQRRQLRMAEVWSSTIGCRNYVIGVHSTDRLVLQKGWRYRYIRIWHRLARSVSYILCISMLYVYIYTLYYRIIVLIYYIYM